MRIKRGFGSSNQLKCRTFREKRERSNRSTEFIHPQFTKTLKTSLPFIQQTLNQSRFALAFAIDLISFFSFRSFFRTYSSRLVPTPIPNTQRISPTLPSSSTRFAESSSADFRTAFRSFPSSPSLPPEHWKRLQSRIQQSLCGLCSRQRDPL